MQTGTYISGVAHIGLVAWMIFGGTFRSEPLPFEVQEVSVISSAEFAALVAPQAAPDITPEPAALPLPDAAPETPEISATPDPVPAPETPPQTAEPAAPAPQPVTPDPLAPLAEGTDVTPEAPEPTIDTAALPDVPRRQPRPADRVAPTPIAPPPPDARPDEVVQQETAPSPDEADAPAEDAATAPEEAGTEIATEANEPPEEVLTTRVTRSPRPLSRPAQPTPGPTQTAEPAPASEPEPEQAAEAEADPVTGSQDAVAAALAEALGGASDPAPAPAGPPLSQGEKDALRVSVSRCWNVGSLSSAALNTTVVVTVAMNQDATPVVPSIEMLSSDGGDATAARQAFEAARRAIIRCGASGFDLPADKYASWRDIEMTFNPERMRIK
ncbi:MAG: energy transducer TonB [Pseudomonadota bacterium]